MKKVRTHDAAEIMRIVARHRGEHVAVEEISEGVELQTPGGRVLISASEIKKDMRNNDSLLRLLEHKMRQAESLSEMGPPMWPKYLVMR